MKIRVDNREQELLKYIRELIVNIPLFKDLEVQVENLPLGDVIISNNVGIANPIKENNSGIVFDFLRLPDSLNSLLLNVMNDENLLSTLKVNGKKFAKENYDTNVVENLIIKHINCD